MESAGQESSHEASEEEMREASSEGERPDDFNPGDEAEIVGEDFDIAEYLAEGDAEPQYMGDVSALQGVMEEMASEEDGPRVGYAEFEGGFNQVVLEESFVLNLKTTMSFVDFKLSLAVNANYPLPAEPEEGREYAYRQGRIFFPNMEQVRWQSRIQPYIDPSSGAVDYGAIDYFYRVGDNRYFLAGYWGEIEITCGAPILEIDELKNQPRPNPPASHPS